MITTDIVIIGGGCVGLTSALGLAQQGHNVMVIDSAGAETELTEPELRVSAISAASENTLTALGAWEQMDQTRFAPYETMKVWDKHNFGRIEFASEQIGEGRLGHIIENNNIRNGLIKAASENANISLRFSTQVQSIHNSEQQVLLTLNDGTPLVAKLCVAADGANSWVRKQLKLPITFSDYDHHALVATIKTELPHNNCARQVFLPEGPLALLPLADANTCSIVWSSVPDKSKALQTMNKTEFEMAMTAATDSELGVIELQSERPAYPLTMRYAQKWVENRVVFVGDAAHTIHPLAGLGMNLGLLDAASLAQLLDKDALSTEKLNKTLSHYQGWRKAEAQNYIAAMGALKELFAGDNPIKKLIRGAGLAVTDNLPLLKDKIIKHAMGMTGDLPELAKSVDPI